MPDAMPVTARDATTILLIMMMINNAELDLRSHFTKYVPIGQHFIFIKSRRFLGGGNLLFLVHTKRKRNGQRLACKKNLERIIKNSPASMNKITLFNFLVTLDCWISVVSCQEKAEQPDVIDIESLTHNGSGCPLNNSVGFFISDDRTALTLLFDDYDVMMGPEISMRESRKNCHINVGLRVPQGWSYSIASVYYDRGYLDLEEGTYSTQGTRFYFSNKDKRTERLETRWEGPLELDYSIREYFQLDKLVWSACGAPDNLNIVSDIRVAGDRSKTAYSVPSYLDGIVSHMYELQWQQC